MAVLEAARSGAAPVLVAAHNHFAVEFLLLLLEGIFHLLPFQSSIPGERVVSERLQAGTTFVWDCSSRNSSCPGATCCQGTPVPKGHHFLTWFCQELPPWPCTVLKIAALPET